MKTKNDHLSPVDHIKKWAGQLEFSRQKTIVLRYIGDCLSAVERLNAQIYGKLMRVHVCVDICSPLYT